MRRAALAAPLGLLLLGGCATTNATPGDPYEKFNRAMWSFNRGADKAIVRPAAQGYRAIVPKPGREGISNFLANVQEPFSMINSILQGKIQRAFVAMGRFMINTTIGVGGLFDQASRLGVKKAPEDLGQTFAVWGVKHSAFVMLPLLGPTTVRDGIGTLAAPYVNPYRLCLSECNFSSTELRLGMTVLELLDTRSQLIESGADTLLDTSADSYAVVRSAYLQRREAEIDDRDDDSASDAGSGGAGDDAALDAALKDVDGSNGAAGSTAPTPTPPADGTATPTTPVPSGETPPASAEPMAPAAPSPQSNAPSQ